MINIQSIQDEVLALHPNHIHYNKPIYQPAELTYWSRLLPWLKEYIETNDVINCIDIGCMCGTLLLYTKTINANINLYAHNLIKFLSDEFINKYDVQFHTGNIELQPFHFKEKFDIIIMTEIIEHFKYNIIPTLTKVVEHLSDNGRLYITTPDANSPIWGKIPKYQSYKDMPYPIDNEEFIDDLGHEYQFVEQELRDIFEECGLIVTQFSNNNYNFNFELMKRGT
jgi:SAM-dependent methyltransferase